MKKKALRNMLEREKNSVKLHKDGTLSTVNVFETVEGNPIQLKSFPDNEQGNLDAEDFFVALMKENVHNFHEYTQKDIDACIEQGYENAGIWSAYLVHSN
jgi:hypothetical protein